MTLVDSDKPGSGQFLEFLNDVEAELRSQGYDLMLIEGVSHKGQQAFFKRNGFTQADRTHPNNPSFYKDLGR